MRKIMILICLLLMRIECIKAEELTVSDMIQKNILINDSAATKKVSESVDKMIEDYVAKSYEFWNEVHQGNKAKQEEELIRKNYVLKPEKSFSFYLMSTEKYLKQYAQSNNVEYLIDDTKYWYPMFFGRFEDKYCFYDDSGEITPWTKNIADDKTIEFLLDPDEIEKIVEEGTDENIIDARIIVLTEKHVGRVIDNDPTTEIEVENIVATVLYLKGENTDYGIKIFTIEPFKKEESYIDDFKLYTMSEIVRSVADYKQISNAIMLETKPTYETEAEALKEAEILTGTDKGLELLKPLSRIEATTILVRILGLENEPTSDVSYFTDIPSDNWGAKYANIAADKNIAAGVGDGLFAPNDTITASQFATLLLRSKGENPDWQTAINLLVERGYLTQEQADKMDLFARGDMAKIIYEARERNLF